MWLPGLLSLVHSLMVPLPGGRVPVACQHKAEPHQFPDQTLHYLGGWSSIVGQPG